MTLGTDEILTGLVPLERIAAVTCLADDEGISNITAQAGEIAGRVGNSAETVIALQPDLVIASTVYPVERLQLIREAGIPVYIYQAPGTIDEIQQAILEIAQVVGQPEAGAALIRQMNDELEQIARVVAKVPEAERLCVLRFSLLGGSGGKGSLFYDICRYAGVKNGAAIAGLNRHELLAKEQIVAVNPDIFFVPTWDFRKKTDLGQFKAEIQNDPALQTVTAVKTRNIVMTPDRHLVCASQYIVAGVRDVAATAYPRYFDRQAADALFLEQER